MSCQVGGCKEATIVKTEIGSEASGQWVRVETCVFHLKNLKELLDEVEKAYHE